MERPYGTGRSSGVISTRSLLGSAPMSKRGASSTPLGLLPRVRDELEHLLDDDNDMAEMYLTEKLVGDSMEQTSLREELYNEALEDDEERAEESTSRHSSEIFTGIKPNIEELEMLLEAYFAQLDGISQKLYNVPSTSTFDHHQNEEQMTSQVLEVGTKVHLFSSKLPREVMAEEIIVSINPVKEVGGLKLGPEFCEVLIEKAIKPRQYLVRRRQGAITVGEAINKCVAWRFVDVERR